jgi:hypothetical protein
MSDPTNSDKRTMDYSAWEREQARRSFTAPVKPPLFSKEPPKDAGWYWVRLKTGQEEHWWSVEFEWDRDKPTLVEAPEYVVEMFNLNWRQFEFGPAIPDPEALAKKDERYKGMVAYGVSLQRIIEDLCRERDAIRKPTGGEIHHYEMAVGRLKVLAAMRKVCDAAGGGEFVRLGQVLNEPSSDWLLNLEEAKEALQAAEQENDR